MPNNNESYQILLVEDDEIDAQNVQREFQKLKIPVKIHVAKDGIEALEMLECAHGSVMLQLILLDINLPRMNGIEFLKKIRADEKYQNIKVFILTTAYTSQDKIATHDLNVNGIIVKPLQSNDVMNIYMNILGPSA